MEGDSISIGTMLALTSVNIMLAHALEGIPIMMSLHIHS